MKRTNWFPLPLFLGLLLVWPALCRADVRLPALISDNMVLQQRTRATLWGRATPNEKITAKIGEVVQGVTAGADGHWSLKLPVLKAGGPYELTISGRNKVVIHNVLVGEVWVCSGQSNMEWRVSGAMNAEKEIAAANYPKIRMFTVAKKVSNVPESDCQGKWEVCAPSVAGTFSAVAYYFGRNIFKSEGTAVGLINSSSGSTTAEDWIPADGLENDPDLKSVVLAKSGDQDMLKEEYKRRYAEWVAASEKAKADNATPPPEPTPPKDPGQNGTLSSVFNGMVSPLLPYSIRGVIWYQGESNVRNAPFYRKLFPALIRGWRQSWGEGDFPFLFVQLPNFLLRKSFPSNSSWAELREAQAMALKLPKTAMAVTIDIGEEHSLHPANKQEVGRRLALAARALVHDEQVSYTGPALVNSKVEGDKIVLTFRSGGGGLVTKEGEAAKGFAIAGADKKFVWADAKIEGDKVVVHSDQVSKPVAVRYAWADNPDCNLFNKAGLPASPFRTDDW